MGEFTHVTVLLQEAVEALQVKPGGVYLDGTLGGGGHTEAILRQSGPDGVVYGIDRDRDALRAAGERLAAFGERLKPLHGNFHDAKALLAAQGVAQLDGAVLDLGVSSFQFDEGERGFSFQEDARLDMRMDQSCGRTAADLCNTLSGEELTRIIRDYGEERWAARIAAFILQAREKKPVETTGELVSIIKAAIPKGARRDGPHPARRTFQALRIAVNDELEPLAKALEELVSLLAPGGRLAVITFHSLEDRIVKQTFKRLQNPCICPPKAPVCTCGKLPVAQVVTRKPILPSPAEVEQNPRSRSAKLRVVQKL
ncbi:16S rRNA (cytosine(1402)-N(4))-methyltransferase RsmH [Christensenellaceae bacterium NSJ-44]|uniref:Ribosomal RNA small subunit methyltransferase H n=1 Tax=Luoshenia tenuis TaxID=2763654 RepID=A0A926D1N2_9FIRM|nr:16S rRNA (cytosine(1402)-N(4))-methyltransferase RsmH [Luoshenia tenuis]MBC8529897.1 16S rRNA (cytosine(1402)-N(4))-methyltransferase RsmH [Luoshenia tenuis]